MNPELGSNGTILVVDDLPATISLVRIALEGRGYAVMVATNGAEAVKRAILTTPDLILLDLLMPGIDGYETCQQLKAQAATRHIPVIFMTVVTETLDKVKGFQLGAVDYLTKPIETQELVARVTTHLTIARLQQELQTVNDRLEQRVAARTAELHAANTQLQIELAERQRAEAQVVKLNRIYAVLSNINQVIVRIHERTHLFQEACRIAVEFGKFPLAWIGLVNLHTQKVEVAASAGVSGAYLEQIALDLNDAHRSKGATGMAVKAGAHSISNDIAHDERMFWRNEALKYGYQSLAAFPLRVFGTVSGVLNVYSDDTDFFDDADIRLLDEIARDISFALEAMEHEAERKRAEEQLRQHARLLEEAVQQKQREMETLFERLLRQEKLATIGQMAGSIAHELRNPLGAVKQSVFYLKRLAQTQEFTAANPKVLRHLDLMDAELNTSERVIADLLEMTRMKAPQRAEIDVRALLTEALARSQLPERVRVTIALTPEPFLIYADPVQMRQVMLNVLTNAAQAIDGDGAIMIRAKQLTEYDESLIEMQDSGVGVAPEALVKVFEPLYTTKATGTGLGLSICKQIIESHQGRISLTSQPGQGATVTIILPRNSHES